MEGARTVAPFSFSDFLLVDFAGSQVMGTRGFAAPGCSTRSLGTAAAAPAGLATGVAGVVLARALHLRWRKTRKGCSLRQELAGVPPASCSFLPPGAGVSTSCSFLRLAAGLPASCACL